MQILNQMTLVLPTLVSNGRINRNRINIVHRVSLVVDISDCLIVSKAHQGLKLLGILIALDLWLIARTLLI